MRNARPLVLERHVEQAPFADLLQGEAQRSALAVGDGVAGYLRHRRGDEGLRLAVETDGARDLAGPLSSMDDVLLRLQVDREKGGRAHAVLLITNTVESSRPRLRSR